MMIHQYEPFKKINNHDTDVFTFLRELSQRQCKSVSELNNGVTICGTTYYFPVAGCKKEMCQVEIEDGRIKVTASAKIGEKVVSYKYNTFIPKTYVNPEAFVTNGLLTVEFEEKSTKTIIEVGG